MLNDIAERAKKGDSQAEEKLFQDLFVRFTQFTTRKMGEEHAEDIAQEACMIVLKKYKETEYEIAFSAWAYGVLKKTIANQLRTSKARQRVMMPESEFDQKSESLSEPYHDPKVGLSTPDHDLKMTLIDCLKMIFSVHPRYARALNLINLGYKAEEISRRLNVKKSYVLVILGRGKKMMRKCLQEGSV